MSSVHFVAIWILEIVIVCTNFENIAAKYESPSTLILMCGEKMKACIWLHTQIKYSPSYPQTDKSTHHMNVSQMMTLWTSQKGFPLVTVNLMGNQVTLAQEHFLLTSDNTTHTSRWVTHYHRDRQTHINHKDTTMLTVVCTLFSLWHIPVTYVNDSCSLAPECRQVFTLKNKSGKRLK